MRIADIATFRPLPPFPPKGLIPKDCAAAQGLPFNPDPPLNDPSSTAESPDAARTESSAASSMRRRILVTERKAPGSMGGGVGLPGRDGGKGGGGGGGNGRGCMGWEENVGDSGREQEESPRMW